MLLAMLIFVNLRAQEPGIEESKAITIEGALDMKQTDGEVFKVVEEMPQFPGGEKEMFMFIALNLKYPEQAKADGIEGRVISQFVVNEDGSISDIKILRGLGGGCGEEAARVIESFPKWKPGKQRGKAVRVKYVLPFAFKLEGNEKLKGGAKKANAKEPLKATMTLARFPGGDSALLKFIKKKKKYPRAARKSRIQGRVIVEFVVKTDGSLSDIRVVKDIGFGCGAEAIRIMKASPNWIPGTNGGKKVETTFTMPIEFKR